MMRNFLISVLAPTAILAQNIVGNPNGAILGIFAMCGTNPVDCGNGWCCLLGQTCTDGPNGANTLCSDQALLNGENGQGGAVVNAAYWGKITGSETKVGGFPISGGQESQGAGSNVEPGIASNTIVPGTASNTASRSSPISTNAFYVANSAVKSTSSTTLVLIFAFIGSSLIIATSL